MKADANPRTTEIVVTATGRGFVDVTPAIAEWVEGSGVSNGLVNVFVRHTSASLVIQENADPDVLRDLEDFFGHLVPDGRAYRHGSEGPDDMPAHIRSALTSTQLSIPILDGRLGLGTWQSVYLYEHRTHARPRKIVLQVLGV